MPDPILMAIAAAIAGKATEVLTGRAGDALGRLTDRVRAAFHQRPAGREALEAARQDPESPERIAALADALRMAGRDDSAFDADLRALWGQVQIHAEVSGDGIANTVHGANIVHGHADKVVQLHDVHGDLNIG